MNGGLHADPTAGPRDGTPGQMVEPAPAAAADPPGLADPPPTGPGPSGVDALVREAVEALEGLRADFDAKIRYDEVKEQQIAGMREELLTHRAGLHLRLLQPIFVDLIAMYDDLTEALDERDRGTPGEDEGEHAQPISAPDAAELLASLRASVVETLERNGVSAYTVDAERVDAARQRVIRVTPTGDEVLDRHVARRLRTGFEYEGRSLRPEWVVAYRHRPGDQPAGRPSEQPSGQAEPAPASVIGTTEGSSSDH